MTATTKRGGARPGAGAPRKPPEQSAVVRFSLALQPAEAAAYKSLGATRWLRRMLAGATSKEQDARAAFAEWWGEYHEQDPLDEAAEAAWLAGCEWQRQQSGGQNGN